ncbi:MAG: tetratricopeptide repeat protein, partial [Planctomycetes bacterium]|nr:tetratricopeptide repeat protein [Planctomycetota bacterium]
ILDRLNAKHIRPDHRAIAVINDYLFNEMGFVAVKTADDPEDLFLHTVIDKRRGYCLSLSVLYLAIGERVGLPLYGVVVPGHFFVRYDDGYKRINIETTSGGHRAPDSHYISEFKPPPEGQSIYMENLTKLGTLGCFFNNLGNSYSDIGDIESAWYQLDRAVQIHPSLAEARVNLGNIYQQKGWPREAIEQYLAALKLVASDPKTHNNLANAYSSMGHFNKAVSEYKKAIRLQADFADAYRNLANTYRKQGSFSKAIAELKAAMKIEPDDGRTWQQLGDVYREKREYTTAISHYNSAMVMDSGLEGV